MPSVPAAPTVILQLCFFFVDSGVLVKVVKDTVLTFRNINVMDLKMTLNNNFNKQTGIRGKPMVLTQDIKYSAQEILMWNKKSTYVETRYEFYLILFLQVLDKMNRC